VLLVVSFEENNVNLSYVKIILSYKKIKDNNPSNSHLIL